jgi:hypothetical protein
LGGSRTAVDIRFGRIPDEPIPAENVRFSQFAFRKLTVGLRPKVAVARRLIDRSNGNSGYL